MAWENNVTLNKSGEYPRCSVLDRNTSKGSPQTLLLSAQLSMAPGLILAQGPSVPPACCTCPELLSRAQQPCWSVQAFLQYLLPPASSKPSFYAFKVLVLAFNRIAPLEKKNTVGPLLAVPNSHPGRNSALIQWKSHLSNNLWTNNLDVFM